jgi:hypothetical protein
MKYLIPLIVLFVLVTTGVGGLLAHLLLAS